MNDFLSALNYMLELRLSGSNFGLERTHELLEILDHPEQKLKIIHVAGTNGKGSTIAMIEAMLRGSGCKVGTFTSPFLEDYLEQIQINRQNLSEKDFITLVNRVKTAVEQVVSVGYSQPTEFELLTVMALLYFAEQNVDYAIIEVGLGGELDSTNVVPPIVTVITSISYDHMNILGSTLTKIAAAKAGIIKSHIPLVLYPQTLEAGQVILARAKSLAAPVYPIKNSDAQLLQVDQTNPAQKVCVFQKYQLILPLLGKHQLLNLATALRAVELALNQTLTQSQLQLALDQVRWPGRFEIVQHRPLVVLDGAHNLDAMQQLKQNLQIYLKYDELYLILGMLKDKQAVEMIQEIAPLAEQVFTLAPKNSRALSSLELADLIRPINPHVKSYDDYQIALTAAVSRAGSNDLVLACGSLYMIGHLRSILQKNQ